LRTDASGIGAGCALFQKDSAGELRPISFYSKKFTEQERKMTAYQREGYALVLGLERFGRYLEGKEFTLQVDNMALKYVLSHGNQLSKLGRWADKILSYQFKVEHIPGRENKVCDVLSRAYEEDHTPSSEQKANPPENQIVKVKKTERCVNPKIKSTS